MVSNHPNLGVNMPAGMAWCIAPTKAMEYARLWEKEDPMDVLQRKAVFLNELRKRTGWRKLMSDCIKTELIRSATVIVNAHGNSTPASLIECATKFLTTQFESETTDSVEPRRGSILRKEN